MKSILFLCNHAAFFVSHRLPIAISCKKENFKVKLLVGKPASDSMEKNAIKQLKKNKIDFDVLKYKSFTYNLFYELIGIFQIFYQLFKFKPDIIHLISPKCVLYGGILAKILNIKCVVISISGVGSIMNINLIIFKKIYFFLLNIVFMNKNKKVIFHNKHDLLLFKKLFKLKSSEVILTYGSGIEINNKISKKRKQSKKIILFPSRVLLDKGIREFLHASKKIKKQFKDWSFVVAGSLDYKSPMSLSQEVVDDSKSFGVKFLGFRKDILDVLNNSTIVCLPSYREGMPKVLLEASILGKPIVTTEIPGCKDIVNLCKNGILVKPRNNYSLFLGLQKMILNKTLRMKYQRNSKKIAKKYFNIKTVINIHLECYKNLYSNVR